MLKALRQSVLYFRLKWRFQHWSIKRIQRHQNRRLTKLFNYLDKKAPYYKGSLSAGGLATLKALAPLSKTRLMENFNQINTAGLDRDTLIQFKIEQEQQGLAELFRGEYSIGLSSGTSGNQSLTVLSARERQDYGPLIMARTNLPQIKGQYRMLFALRVNNPAFMEINNRKLFLTHVNYTHEPEDLVQIINEKRLNILAGPPSLLRILAEFVHRLKQPIEGIISYAEVLTPDTKQFLERTFRVQVLQIYQGAEGFLAGTCSAGNLHLNEDTTLVELFDVSGEDKNIKRVVITDLYRTTLPFIRYELNDLLEIETEPCSCGSKFRRIKQIHGRADDLFELNGLNGELRYLFPDYIRRSIIQASPEIVEYQAIQKSRTDIEIRLVLNNEAGLNHIQTQITENLSRWVIRSGGIMPKIQFSKNAPQVHPLSKKMIRIRRDF